VTFPNDLATTNLIVRGELRPGDKMVFSLPLAHPTSLKIVTAVMTSISSIWVRPVPPCETTLAAGQTGQSIVFLLLAPALIVGQGGPLTAILNLP